MTHVAAARALVWGTALILLFGAVILAGRAAPKPTPVLTARPSGDPALARCRAAGAAALDDPSCRKAWDAARARFFGASPEAGS
jgi:conjugative transfer region protein TrbK